MINQLMASIKTDSKTLDDFLINIKNHDVVILLQNFDQFMLREGVIRVYEFFWRVIRETNYLKLLVAGGLEEGSDVA